MEELNSETLHSGIHAELWSQALIDSVNESAYYRNLLDGVAGAGIGGKLDIIYK